MIEVTFKDGTVGPLKHDRLVQFDERSKDYPLLAADDTRDLVSTRWEIAKHIDQGREGSCAGIAFLHMLIAEPFYCMGLDKQYGVERLYWPAQRVDAWEGGSYPGANPVYEGTSLIAVLKTAVALGWISSYHWTFSLEELARGLVYEGPAYIGVRVYAGMTTPDQDGFIYPTGKLRGGHAIVIKAFTLKESLDTSIFTIHQSWGTSHGIDGDVKMYGKDLAFLLSKQGEAAFIKRLKQ